jgi:hypothetical protein
MVHKYVIIAIVLLLLVELIVAGGSVSKKATKVRRKSASAIRSGSKAVARGSSRVKSRWKEQRSYDNARSSTFFLLFLHKIGVRIFFAPHS